MGFEEHEAVLSGLCSGSGFMGFDLGSGSGPVYPIDVMSHDDVGIRGIQGGTVSNSVVGESS
ncbi:hypothetical protein F2Q68_00000903 [Brassica cretica]|uniref:Uncharacterized protein n=1 Tax=Brassica cretica TaxID=69181 RepID=A0A8S9J664_BRACR|nr:hypothetical protein F2Q68_00000903 [Brassica cretica]